MLAVLSDDAESERSEGKIIPIKPCELTEAQRTAITMICQGFQTHEIAKACGVDRKSVQNWKKKPAFIVALSQAEKNTMQTRGAIPTPKPTKAKPRITGPIDLDRLDAASMQTVFERVCLGDGKLALEVMKARGLIKPKEEKQDDTPVVVQFGELPKDEAELEEILREAPPPVSLEPTYKPKDTK